MVAVRIAKQMIDFQKTAFDTTFNAVVMFQDQTEKMAGKLLNEITWIPAEGKKAIDDWAKAYKLGSENLKKSMDENFKRADDFFCCLK
jgi:hypothetical protein